MYEVLNYRSKLKYYHRDVVKDGQKVFLNQVSLKEQQRDTKLHNRQIFKKSFKENSKENILFQ